ncbi:MAG: tetratricopeptide repeat protein [Pseudomonadota bacterium]
MDAHSEQDELDKLKAWWKTYGNSLIAGVVLGVAILVGGKYWTQHQNSQREEASALYEDMLTAARERKGDQLATLAGRLQKEYARTPYAGMGALLAARTHFDAGNAEAARQQLDWAVQNARHEPTVHVARLRLARLHAAGGRLDAALALIPAKDLGGFETEYHELKGDLLLAQGKHQEARLAYRQAIRQQRDLGPHRQVLRMKLADLGDST